MLNKNIMFISILIICFLAISCVSAAETDNVDSQINDSAINSTDISTDEVVVYNIHNSKEFLNLADQLSQYDNPNLSKNIVINLDPNKEYKFNSDITDTHLKNRVIDDYGFVIRASDINLVINGNGSKIRNEDEYTLGFLYIHEGATVTLNNVTISDFKLGVVNEGALQTNKCKFVNNVNKNFLKDNALFDNHGGAILNFNTVYCYDTTFDSNDAGHQGTETRRLNSPVTYVTRGGAVCAENNSKSFIFNCIFKKENDNIYVADDAFVFINTTTNNVKEIRKYIAQDSNKSSVVIKTLTTTTPNIYEVTVTDAKELNEALIEPHYDTWGIRINLTNNIKLEEYTKFIISEPVEIISPTNSTIQGSDYSSFQINKESSLYTEGVNFKEFDLVFENRGTLNCNNIEFYMNELVLKNIKGSFKFVNCDFKGRYGSIETEGKSTSYLINCSFETWTGLSVWEKITNWIPGLNKQEVAISNYDSRIILVNTNCTYECDGKGGGVVYIHDSESPLITTYDVTDSKTLKEAANNVWKDNGYSDQIIINFINSDTINMECFDGNLFHPRFTTLIFNGNGNTIQAKNNKKNDLFKFIYVEKNCLVIINNLTISKFNTAILNYGTCIITNSVLDHNCIDTLVKEDYGGAIDNRGLLICSNSSFTNNYGKYGGAIYNLGYVSLDNCYFNNNIAYSSEGCNDVYNRDSAFCTITNSTQTININQRYSMSKLTRDLVYTMIECSPALFGTSTAAIISTYYGVGAGLIVGFVVGATPSIIGTRIMAEDSQAWEGWRVGLDITNILMSSFMYAKMGAIHIKAIYQKAFEEPAVEPVKEVLDPLTNEPLGDKLSPHEYYQVIDINDEDNVIRIEGRDTHNIVEAKFINGELITLKDGVAIDQSGIRWNDPYLEAKFKELFSKSLPLDSPIQEKPKNYHITNIIEGMNDGGMINYLDDGETKTAYFSKFGTITDSDGKVISPDLFKTYENPYNKGIPWMLEYVFRHVEIVAPTGI